MTKQEFVKAWKHNVERVQRWIRDARKRGLTVDYTFEEMPKNVSPAKLRDFVESTQPVKMYQYATTKTEKGETISGYKVRTYQYEKAAETRRENSVRRYKEKVERDYTENWEEDNTEYNWLDPSSYDNDKEWVEPPHISGVMYENLRRFLEQFTHDDFRNFPSSGRGLRFLEALLAKYYTANELLALLDMLIQEEGENALFTRLEQSATKLNDLMSDFIRASEQSSVNACATTMATIIKGSPLSFDEASALDDAYDDMESD